MKSWGLRLRKGHRAYSCQCDGKLLAQKGTGEGISFFIVWGGFWDGKEIQHRKNVFMSKMYIETNAQR